MESKKTIENEEEITNDSETVTDDTPIFQFESEEIEMYRCNFADLLSFKVLLSNAVSNKQADDILDKVFYHYEIVECDSKYSYGDYCVDDIV